MPRPPLPRPLAGRSKHTAPLRKDLIIEQAAKSKLQQSDYYGVRAVSCKFHEGVLTLDGQVPNYYLKQIAQTLVYQIEGVEELNNRVRVVPPRHPDVP